ncbi:MAG: hypothetical protein QGI45_13355 [Myxococcota bacterium]|jgi:hypothetical protein|nr:hypothetical protein [Myxococcota bacterium]
MPKHVSAKFQAGHILGLLPFIRTTNMTKQSLFFRTDALYWLTICLVLTLFYSPMVILDPIHFQDRYTLLDRLFSIHSLEHFLHTLLNGEVGYLLEDLSLLVDITLKKTFNISSFHGTNLLIWVGILVCVNNLQQLCDLPKLTRYLSGCTIAFTPYFTQSVLSISARGCLLSCLFLCLATFCLLKNNLADNKKSPQNAPALLFYLLAMLSSSVFAAWGLWAAYYCYRQRHTHKKYRYGCACFILATAFTLMSIIMQQVGNPFVPLWQARLFDAPLEAFTLVLFNISRNVFNLLIPFHLFPASGAASFLNFLGIIPLAFFLLSSRLKKTVPLSDSWFGLICCTSFGVILTTPIFFAHAPFFLFPGIMIFLYIVVLLNRNKKVLQGILVVTLLGFALRTVHTVEHWQNEKSLWLNAYLNGSPAEALPWLVEIMIAKEEPNIPVIFALQLKEKRPQHPDIPYLYAKAVYHDNVIHSRAKPRIIAQQKEQNAWSQYYLALSYHALQNESKAYEAIHHALYEAELFGEAIETIVADAYYICQQAFRPNCRQLTTRIQTQHPTHFWNQNVFEKRLQKLGYGMANQLHRHLE